MNRRLLHGGLGALGFSLALCGCTPAAIGGEATLVKGRDALLRQRPADAATCPAGGVILESGRDLDSDGVLGEDEVEDSVPVCDGADGADGDAELVVASRSDALPACDGRAGVVLRTGADADGDGAVDVVQEEAVLCDGADGVAPSLLYDLDTLPVGDATCPTGGLGLRLGPDADADGVLDDDEVLVELTRSVCNGQAGDVGDGGASGAPALVAPVAVPPGACPAGGTAFAIGVDGDGDGELGGAEVDDTLVLCDGLDAVPGGGGGGGGGGRSEGSVDVPIALVLQDELAPGANGTRTVGALGRSRYVVNGVGGPAVYTVVIEGPESDVDVLVDDGDGFILLTCELTGARRACVTPRLVNSTIRVDVVERRALPSTFSLGVALGTSVGGVAPVPLTSAPLPTGVIDGRASVFVVPAADLTANSGMLLELDEVQRLSPPSFTDAVTPERELQLQVHRGTRDGALVQSCIGTAFFPCGIPALEEDAVVVVSHRAGRGASFSLRARSAAEALPLLENGDVIPARAARIRGSANGGAFTVGARDSRLRVLADVDDLATADFSSGIFESIAVQLPPGQERIVVISSSSAEAPALTRADVADDEGTDAALPVAIGDVHIGSAGSLSRYRIERPAGGPVTATIATRIGRVTCAFFADEALTIRAGGVPVARGRFDTRVVEQACVSDDLPAGAPLFLRVQGEDAVFELGIAAGDLEHPTLGIDADIDLNLGAGGGVVPRAFRLDHGAFRGPLRIDVFATVDEPDVTLFIGPPSFAGGTTVVSSTPGVADFPVGSTFTHTGVSALAAGPASYLTFVPTLVSSDLQLVFSRPPVIDVAAHTDVALVGDEGRLAPDSERWFRFSVDAGSALTVRATTSAITFASRVRLWREGEPVPLTAEASFRRLTGVQEASLTPTAALAAGTYLVQVRTPHRDVLNVVRTDPIDTLRFEVVP